MRISNEKAVGWIVAIVVAAVSRYFAIFVSAELVLDSFNVDHDWLTLGRTIIALTFIGFFAPNPGKELKAENLGGSALAWSMRKIFEAWFLAGFVYGFKLVFA